MRIVAIMVVLAAVVLLGYFAWPLLHPETVQGPGRHHAAPGDRSQAVKADHPEQAAGAATPDVQPKAHADEPAVAGPLCDAQYESLSGRPLALPAGQAVRKGPAVRGQAWTWVNLWAAWCKPCKEEMPVLAGWAARLRDRGGSLRVVFLSLDDDERQLRRYLRGEGAGIDGDILWASDEGPRTRFLAAAGLPPSPTLPVQILIDPAGRLRCVRVGSIADKDLDEAARRFSF